ncbi:MAG: hypothetical protein RLZ33_183, partial [Bacteroidota bacterium]
QNVTCKHNSHAQTDIQMRKIIFLLLTLTQISCESQTNDIHAFKDDELTFKVQYKPEKKYSQTIEQTSHTDIKYSGSEEFLQKLKDKGVQNPTITDKATKIESIFKTGKLTDGTNFPLTMEFIKTTSSDGKKEIPDGTLIYGHCSIGNMPTLDSIASDELDEEFKKALLQAMQSSLSQLSLPEKRVKVGESFSRESPLSMPIAGVTVEMTITTNYKLLGITNGIADFDVSQVYTMKSTITKHTIKATGNGKGKLLYDVSNNYYLKYQIDTEMGMNMKLDNFDLDLNSKSGFIQTTVITTN